MKVIAKYKKVEITFTSQCVSLNFNSVKDALTYTEWYKRAIITRVRASSDISYPSELYSYLKNKGIINTEQFLSRQSMLRKANLLSSLQSHWL
ncbi:hypothetical protein D3H66_19360 [Citrobacter portucalensis]|uniref:Uncharacterized protein n=1 Tax=Citrobacter portucalensis TaxID=1639133 RepID=A0A5B0SWG5_9ENTR|nr:hypothetical protein D3H66_19360 [Citrobacter portucalensis]